MTTATLVRASTTSAESTRPATRWLGLSVVLVAMFMAQFDLYVVNVSLPLLQRDLHAGQGALELIVAGYAFMYATGLITCGRLGDMYGHRRLFVVGTVTFAGCSLLAGLSQTSGELVVFRLLQGLAASAMVPQVLATITALFAPDERPRAMSWFGVTVGVGAVAGQVLGGLLLDVNLAGLGWRPIFLVNVPIGLLAACFAARLLPDTATAVRPKMDPLGTVLISGALALILVPLSLGRSAHWPVWTWACLAASPIVIGMALKWERRLQDAGGQPFLDLHLFEERAFNLGIIGNVAAFGAFYSFLFTLSLLLQSGLGLTPLQAGLSFAPLGVAFASASIAAKSFVKRYGAKVITIGMFVTCVGLLALLIVVHEARDALTVGELIGPMAVIGLGNGLAVPSLIGAVLAGIRVQQAGAAAGVLTTSQQFAGAVSIAGLGGLFFGVLGTRGGLGAYTEAIQWSGGAALLLVAVAAYISLRLVRRSTTVEPTAPASPG